ncbi:MAG: ROK family transcriptional regulator [Bacteroidota bacterium]
MNTSRKTKHEHVVSANSRVVRNINRGVILSVIRERQPISRAAIARVTRLNKSTVSSIVSGLLKEDLIAENAERSETIGRHPLSLRLRKGRNLYGAISFDSAATRVAVVDIDGTVMQTDKIPTDSHSPEEFVSNCVKTLVSLRTRNRLPQFKGVGISVAGVVDSPQARVVFAPNLGWENVAIGDVLRRCCPEVQVTAVENDAKAAALGELWFGRHDINLSNFVFLSVGRGIGTGIVIDRRILNGDTHLAGEFGHMVLLEGGAPCACGNRGCWEAYASDIATARRYALARGLGGGKEDSLTIDDVIAAARAGDPLAVEELRISGKFIGIGVANVIKAVDPAAIIIGGHITRAWDLVSSSIIQEVRSRSFFGKYHGTPILPTSLTARPSLLGAAALAVRRSFGDVRLTL